MNDAGRRFLGNVTLLDVLQSSYLVGKPAEGIMSFSRNLLLGVGTVLLGHRVHAWLLIGESVISESRPALLLLLLGENLNSGCSIVYGRRR